MTTDDLCGMQARVRRNIYNKALADDGAGTNAKTVNAKDCNCDLPMGAKAMPGV